MKRCKGPLKRTTCDGTKSDGFPTLEFLSPFLDVIFLSPHDPGQLKEKRSNQHRLIRQSPALAGSLGLSNNTNTAKTLQMFWTFLDEVASRFWL